MPVLMAGKEMDFRPPIDRPTKFISSLASKLKLNGLVEERSLRILELAQRNKLVVGKNPRGVAAAVLYLACQGVGVSITQAEVARAADTSEVTMRKRFKPAALYASMARTMAALPATGKQTLC